MAAEAQVWAAYTFVCTPYARACTLESDPTHWHGPDALTPPGTATRRQCHRGDAQTAWVAPAPPSPIACWRLTCVCKSVVWSAHTTCKTCIHPHSAEHKDAHSHTQDARRTHASRPHTRRALSMTSHAHARINPRVYTYARTNARMHVLPSAMPILPHLPQVQALALKKCLPSMAWLRARQRTIQGQLGQEVLAKSAMQHQGTTTTNIQIQKLYYCPRSSTTVKASCGAPRTGKRRMWNRRRATKRAENLLCLHGSHDTTGAGQDMVLMIGQACFHPAYPEDA